MKKESIDALARELNITYDEVLIRLEQICFRGDDIYMDNMKKEDIVIMFKEVK